MGYSKQATGEIEQLCIPIPQDVQNMAWQDAQEQSNVLARHRSYLNRVVLEIFKDWLTYWLADDLPVAPTIWPEKEALSTFLELVAGTVLQLGDTKLVIIPIDDGGQDFFEVPQEWIDIEPWVIDYAIATHLHIDEDDDQDWLEILGFTTHRQLKHQGQYHEKTRTYGLPWADLKVDLTTMSITLGLPVKAPVSGLLPLIEADAENYIQQLSDPSIYEPRLQSMLSFEQWATLITHDAWREQLHQQRLQAASLQETVSQETAAQETGQIESKTFNLGQWLNNQFEPVWQAVDQLLDLQPQNQAYAFMAHDLALIRRARLVDLEMYLKGKAVTLLVALIPDAAQMTEVRVQLFPAKDSYHLPSNLHLALLAQSGRLIKQVSSREHDYCIQLNPFKYKAGRCFRIRLTLGEQTVITDDIYMV